MRLFIRAFTTWVMLTSTADLIHDGYHLPDVLLIALAAFLFWTTFEDKTETKEKP